MFVNLWGYIHILYIQKRKKKKKRFHIRGFVVVKFCKKEKE